MNKTTFLAMAAAVAMTGTALAQDGPPHGPPPDPYGDATITKAEAQKAAAARFDRLDTNHDGNLSADEIAAAPGGGRGFGRPDANGLISKAQFLAMQAERFDRQDANHDGQLTKAERDAFRQQMMERMRGAGGPGGPGGQ